MLFLILILFHHPLYFVAVSGEPLLMMGVVFELVAV